MTPSSDTDSLASTDAPEHTVHVLHDFLTHWQDEDAGDDGDGASEELLTNSSGSAMHARAERRHRRTSRYAEVTQLHEQVKALEGELMIVREQWKRRASSAVRQAIARNNATTTDDSKDQVNWRTIALREKRLLRQSQHVMHGLHDDIFKHRKAIRNTRRRLGNARRLAVAEKISRARRASVHPISCLLAGVALSQLSTRPSTLVMMQQLFQDPFANLPAIQPDQVFTGRHAIFESLLHDIESMWREFPSVDALLASYNTVPAQANHAVKKWSVQDAPARDLVVDLVDCYAVPFDCTEVQKAILQLHSEIKRTVCEKQRMEYLYKAENTIARQYVEYYDNYDRSGYVRVTQVVANYQNDDDTQSVVLVASHMQPVTGAGEAIDAIALRERRWTITRNIRGNDDCVSAGCATSTIKTYGKINPAMVRPELGGQWTRALLEEPFIELCDKSLSDFHRYLESCLVQQVMSNKRGDKKVHETEMLCKPAISITRPVEMVCSSLVE